MGNGGDGVPDLSSRGWQNVDGGDAASYAAALTRGRVTATRDDAVRLLGVEHGSVVLDIGCGVGDLLAAVNAGALRIGVDRSAHLLRHVTAYGITAVQALAEHLPIRSRSVDTAHIERVLLHVDAPNRAVAELARVLRKDGLVLLTEPDWLSFTVDADRKLAAFVERTFRAGVHQPDIGRRLERLVEHADLVVERVEVLPIARVGAREVDPAGVIDGLLVDAEARGELGMETVVAWRDLDRPVSSMNTTYRVLARRR